MPYNRNNEELYLPTDDTIDVGKEPLPLESAALKAVVERCKEFIRKELLST